MVTILFTILTVSAIALLVGFILALRAVAKRCHRSVSQSHPMGQSG
jgi:hypothetical protein